MAIERGAFDRWRNTSNARRDVPPPPERRPEPPIFPNVDPVYDLKRRVARKWSLTPEARQDLMRVPTAVTYTEENPFAREAAGRYYGGGAQGSVDDPYPSHGERIWTHYYDAPRAENTLAHEYMHKRYYEDLAPETRQRWEEDFPAIVQSQTPERTIDVSAWPATELHAEMGREYGPSIKPNIREEYFPGVFQAGLEPTPYGYRQPSRQTPLANPWRYAETGPGWERAKSQEFWEYMPEYWGGPYRPYNMPSAEQLGMRWG